MLLTFATIVLAVQLGVDKYMAAHLWMGIDGIIFHWGRNFLLPWSALMALIIFLMVVEKGAGRRPLLISTVREIGRRRRHLAWAVVAIIAMQAVSIWVQDGIGALLDPLYQQPKPFLLRNLLYLGFYFTFSYARLWATVAILTYALRASYRQLGAPKPAA